jgi:hypothetical protein
MATPMTELATAVNELKALNAPAVKLSQVQRFIELGEDSGIIVNNEIVQATVAKLAKNIQATVTNLEST